MNWDPEFLSWLRSPDTKQPLAPLEPAQLTLLNEQIRAGGVVDRGGEAVTEELDDALRPVGEDVAYPVLHEIPELLESKAIALPAEVLQA